jgi:flagellar hook-basal body complex protein FliE
MKIPSEITAALSPERASIGMPAGLGAEDGEASGFDVHLQAALAEADKVTKGADRTAEGLVTGEVDIHEAMVAMEKADLVLKFGATVRNKMLEAYQQLVQAGG